MLFFCPPPDPGRPYTETVSTAPYTGPVPPERPKSNRERTLNYGEALKKQVRRTVEIISFVRNSLHKQHLILFIILSLCLWCNCEYCCCDNFISPMDGCIPPPNNSIVNTWGTIRFWDVTILKCYNLIQWDYDLTCYSCSIW